MPKNPIKVTGSLFQSKGLRDSLKVHKAVVVSLAIGEQDLPNNLFI